MRKLFSTASMRDNPRVPSDWLTLVPPPLGRGGFGQVYRAVEGGVERAVKVIAEDLRGDEEAVARFEREARVLERLSHPGLIRGFGLRDTPYGPGLVMELAQGTLLDRLVREGRWPWEQVARDFPVLLEALHLLHLEGVVHRDVKPQNILEVSGALKLADFGIVRLGEGWATSRNLTVTGFQPGTPTYQSPEQVRGQEDLDGRSDLYSFGVVLYGALCEDYYLDASRYRNEFELQLGILQDPPRRPPADLGLPPALVRLLERLLAKDRDDRPRTALEAADLMRRALEPSLPVRFEAAPAIAADPPPADVRAMAGYLAAAFPRQVKRVIVQAGRPGEWGELERPLPAPVRAGLSRLGIEQLYAHQAAGMNAIRRGEDTVLVTGTASGKTLAYTLPILERLGENPGARALYLFPLKALANDQWYALERLRDAMGLAVTAGRFDGDTPSAARRAVEVNPPQALFATPDILHASVLKNPAKWAAFWRGLEFVVIDEVHSYVGAFGSHVANVLRRLQSIAARYGARPRFVLASATIDGPLEHAYALTGRNFTLVDTDAAPRSERHFVFWEPFGSRLERSEQWLSDTEEVMARLVVAGYSTITFPTGRQQAERLAKRVAEKVGAAGLDPGLVVVYRGGLLPAERQSLEARLKRGEVRGVVSTSALEVGVDIGSLDAVILSGLPNTVMSTWQRVGRAGRRGQAALIVAIARPNRHDLYHLEHPEAFLARPPEPAAVYPDHDPVRDVHLAAALKEGSLTGPRDVPPWPASALVRVGREPRPQDVYPHPHAVGLRGFDERVLIREGERDVGEATWSQAIRELHPEALYNHGGRTYRVATLERGVAEVVRASTTRYTRPITEVRVIPRAAEGELEAAGFTLRRGGLGVRTFTNGYREFDANDRPLRTVTFPRPLEHQLHTRGAWLSLPTDLAEELDDGRDRQAPDDPSPALAAAHAAEHLLGFALTLITGCAPADLSGLPQRQAGGALTIYLWDTSPDGLELAETFFRRSGEVVERSIELGRCDCGRHEGCPKCTIDPACALHNGQLWRAGGLNVLGRLRDGLAAMSVAVGA